jgi:hypothetical protein
MVKPSARSFGLPWRRADVDGDGKVSATELETALRAHAAHLGRWAERVVGDADRSGDHRIGPAEVTAAERGSGGAAEPGATDGGKGTETPRR